MTMNVANRKCIRHISFRNMKAAKARNIIAIIAITLTTILFTTLFTIMMTIISASEQSSFRRVGSYSHGGFKNLTKEQMEELQNDPLIAQHGVRHYLGTPVEAPLNKTHVEISRMDENYAKWCFLEPKDGHFPQEGTYEAATDTVVLSLLGVKPEIGAKFDITFPVDGITITREFTLCGYWEYDSASPAHHILLSESCVDEILEELNTQCLDGMTGLYTMDIMLNSDSHIQDNLLTILAHHGYQGTQFGVENYIDISVNWGYLSATLDGAFDFGTFFSIAALLLLIIFTGYLIIYNIFQISVGGDIRFYGLLKTIGTTGRQIKHIISMQAIFLSALGIPIGLLAGYGIGAVLTPSVLSTVNVSTYTLSISPFIFIGSALFSLLTVLISCNKPGRLAAKVSPIEAIRYTDTASSQIRKKQKNNTTDGASIYRMAWANLGRNRKKTVITVLSLSLSVILLNITAASSKSFDLNQYLYNLKGVVSDFILADARYFQPSSRFIQEWNVSDDAIASLEKSDLIIDGGRTYGYYGSIQEFVSEEAYYASHNSLYSETTIQNQLAELHHENGKVLENVQLYGMELFCLDKLHIVEGSLDKIKQNPDGRYIAAICYCDKNGNIRKGSCWTNLGDTVTIRYIDETEIYHTVTGEIYPDVESIPNADLPYVDVRILSYRDMEYEVAALVEIPNSLSYRYSGSYFSYVLDAATFIKDTKTNAVMYYTFDAKEDKIASMEEYISDLTDTAMPQFNYESKKTFADAFYTFTRMYLLCGSIVSFIIGLVGILNFLNAVLTSILTRHREFALLQSVGMSRRQLRTLLITESVILSLSAVIVSLILTIATAPLVSNLLSSMFAFFVYHFTLLPLVIVTPAFILLGVTLPVIIYRLVPSKSIVERLREAE